MKRTAVALFAFTLIAWSGALVEAFGNPAAAAGGTRTAAVRSTTGIANPIAPVASLWALCGPSGCLVCNGLTCRWLPN